MTKNPGPVHDARYDRFMVGSRRLSGFESFAVCALFALAAGRCVVVADDGADDGAEAGAPNGGGGTSNDGPTRASGGSRMASGGSSAGSGGSDAPQGGSNAGGTRPTDGGEAGASGEGTGPGGTGAEIFSVVSSDGYVRTPPPACVGEVAADGWCVGTDGPRPSPLACAVPDEVISFDASDDENCPFCAAPPVGEVTRPCPDARAIYRDFVWDLVSSSCANACESHADCAAWEVVNACGDFVFSLNGFIDEVPLAYMEEYASAHCSACGTTAQRMYLRRAGSRVIEFGAPSGALLEGFESRCVERQCVLTRY
jgi:hypothetical protein